MRLRDWAVGLLEHRPDSDGDGEGDAEMESVRVMLDSDADADCETWDKERLGVGVVEDERV